MVMRLKSLLNLLTLPEGDSLEFKRQLDFSDSGKRELAKDCCGFANAKGGMIIIGVSNRTRKLVGLERPLDSEQIMQIVRSGTYPPVEITARTLRAGKSELGVIQIPEGSYAHELKGDRVVYIRKGPITVPASGPEIARLFSLRQRITQTVFEEPFQPVEDDDRIFLLSGDSYPYRTISKTGSFWQLSQCPVFLPELTVHVEPPQFAGLGSPILVGYHSLRDLTIGEFTNKAGRVETLLSSMLQYFDVQPKLYWSISTNGKLTYGSGMNNLQRALTDGHLGVICLATCGEFRGSPTKASFMLVISGYCRGRPGQEIVSYPTMDLYLSFIPVSNDWLEDLFKPFVNEERLPFHSLSYESGRAELKIWRPRVSPKMKPRIMGVIRRYRYRPKGPFEIGAVISDSAWYSPRLYEFVHAMIPKTSTQLLPYGFPYKQNQDRRDQNPVELLDELVVRLTNPVPAYDDVFKGPPEGVDSFTLPLIQQLTLEGDGHTVHVLGLNGGPSAPRGQFSTHAEERLLRTRSQIRRPPKAEN